MIWFFFVSDLDLVSVDCDLDCVSVDVVVEFALWEGLLSLFFDVFHVFLYCSHKSFFSSSVAFLQFISLCCPPHLRHLIGFLKRLAALAEG